MSDILLVLLLCTVFSTIAPLMHPVGLLFFVLRLGAVKSKVLFRHEASYEGAAAVWTPARGRVGAALMIYQATLAGIFGLKRAPVPAALLIGCVMPATAAALAAMRERFAPAVPGTAPPPLAWFAPPATPLGKAAAMEKAEQAEGDIWEAQAHETEEHADAAAAAFLPPGLQPPEETDLGEVVLKRSGSSARDLEQAVLEDGAAAPVARHSALLRAREEAEEAEEEAEQWHNARA